jgi:hypothetical protein
MPQSVATGLDYPPLQEFPPHPGNTILDGRGYSGEATIATAPRNHRLPRLPPARNYPFV